MYEAVAVFSTESSLIYEVSHYVGQISIRGDRTWLGTYIICISSNGEVYCDCNGEHIETS